MRCRFADIAPSVRCRFADIATSVSCNTPTPHQTVSCLRAVFHRPTMQLAPRVDVDITRGQELALVFRCRRAKHRSVAMAELTSWLLQLTTHMQVSCGRVSLCRSLSLFFITVSVYSSVSLSVSLVLGLSFSCSRLFFVAHLFLTSVPSLFLPWPLHLSTFFGAPTPLHLTLQVELIHCGRFLCRCRECHGNAEHVQGANGRLAMRLWADAIAHAAR